jgi:hypothetical protein
MLQRSALPLAIAVLSAFPVALAQPMIAQLAITENSLAAQAVYDE